MKRDWNPCRVSYGVWQRANTDKTWDYTKGEATAQVSQGLGCMASDDPVSGLGSGVRDAPFWGS